MKISQRSIIVSSVRFGAIVGLLFWAFFLLKYGTFAIQVYPDPDSRPIVINHSFDPLALAVLCYCFRVFWAIHYVRVATVKGLLLDIIAVVPCIIFLLGMVTTFCLGWTGALLSMLLVVALFGIAAIIGIPLVLILALCASRKTHDSIRPLSMH